MSFPRQFSLYLPKYLLDQIRQRASVNGRSRNAEFSHILDVGLEYTGDEDVKVDLPGRDVCEWIRAVGRFDNETLALMEERGSRFGRSAGREIVRLTAYALEETARRDLTIIAEMMSRQGLVAQSG
jgi:hypothetical protein